MNTTNNVGGANAAAKYGSVGRLDDGRSFVIFERRLAHSIDKVWTAISDPAQLTKWFPEIQLELREGGRFEINFGGECDPDAPALVTGTVTRFEPPNVLELGSMRFELEGDGSGCVLTFIDILQFQGARSRTDFTNSVLGGWHSFLDRLGEALAGNEVDLDRLEPDYSKIEVAGRE